MEMYTGKSIFKGIAIGKILFYQKGEQPVKRVKIEDTAEQIKRYEDARAKAAEQLQGLYEKALKEVGEANAAVFEVHQMMLVEGEYIEAIRNRIRTESVNAEYAATAAGEYIAEKIRKMDGDIRKGHIKRVHKGKCKAGLTAAFNEILHNVERIGNSCVNLADAAEDGVRFSTFLREME